MQGEYIGSSAEGGKICAPILRKKINMTKGETSFLHINTLGYHEIYINGRKVGEDVLTPAVSHLSKRSLIVTYDICLSGWDKVGIKRRLSELLMKVRW